MRSSNSNKGSLTVSLKEQPADSKKANFGLSKPNVDEEHT